ncbi:MAG: hypothetical protein EOO31_01780 [Comamonadaceae bacterium]|nr:MAG: hypothetical protein EOO31_01780 [Comamonadaceae bacterium]
MRMVFGLVGILVALVIVGVLAKQQLASTRGAVPAVAVPGAPSPAAGASAVTVRDQSQQMQQQVKQQVEGLMQQARPMPDEDTK